MLNVLWPAQQRERSADRPLGQLGLASLLMCVVLLVLIGAASVWAAWRTGLAFEEAQKLRRERALVTNILLEIEGAETAQRGFMLTLNEDYIGGLKHAVQVMPGMLSQMEQDWHGDARIVLFRQVMTAKLAELDQTVELARSGDLDDAMAIVRTNNGRRNMLIVRQMVSTLQAELDTHLAEEVRAADRDNRIVVAVAIVGLLTIALLAAQILFAVRRYLASLAVAREMAAKAYGRAGTK